MNYKNYIIYVRTQVSILVSQGGIPIPPCGKPAHNLLLRMETLA